MNSAYQKGREFRNKFYGLLPDEEDPSIDIKSIVKSFCSRKRRNQVSLFMRMKGLFQNSNLFQNIDVYNLNTSITEFLRKNFDTQFPNDYMFNALENTKCRQIIEERFNKSKNIENIHTMVKKITGMHSYEFDQYFLSLPNEMHTYIKVFYVADYLERYMENRVDISESEYRLKEFLSSYYKLIVDSTADEPSLNRLFTSKIYLEILNSFENKINGKDNKMLILFSSHDVTMSAFIHSLKANAKDFNYDFNDEINFVLYEFEEEFFVSIKYNNEELKLNFCEGKKICEYLKFKEFVENIIIPEEDLRKFCDGSIKTLHNEKTYDVSFKTDDL